VRRPRGRRHPEALARPLLFATPMEAYRHILVPTDFGGPTERAVDVAIHLASAFGARITLLHVVPEAPFGDPVEWKKIVIPQAAKSLEDALARVRSRYADCSSAMRMGSPADQVAEAAGDDAVDLVVVGTHGRHGVPRFLVGSVAEKVVRLSPVPVLTVHEAAAVEA
jgi:nucleotide-binding universal stress UspA family protein